MSEYTTPGLESFNHLLFGDRRADVAMRFLRGHLLIEQAVTDLIHVRAVKPKALIHKRTMMSQKLNLCEGVGWLPDQLITALRAVTDRRNDLAHALNERLTVERVDSLYEALTGELRRAVDAVLAERFTDPAGKVLFLADMNREGVIWSFVSESRLTAILLILSMEVGHELQLARYERDNQDKLRAFHLALAADELDGLPSRESVIRERLQLPEPPDRRGALAALFPSPGDDDDV